MAAADQIVIAISADYILVTAAAAAVMLFDAVLTVSRFIVDRTNHLLRYGGPTYTPAALLSDNLRGVLNKY